MWCSPAPAVPVANIAFDGLAVSALPLHANIFIKTITRRYPDFDEIVCDLITITGERYDRDVADTKPGKQVL